MSINIAYPNNIHSTSHQHVVKGRGVTIAMAVIPQLKGKNQPSKLWKVLFDSVSDGDIVFIRKSEESSIGMHNRLHP